MTGNDINIGGTIEHPSFFVVFSTDVNTDVNNVSDVNIATSELTEKNINIGGEIKQTGFTVVGTDVNTDLKERQRCLSIATSNRID